MTKLLTIVGMGTGVAMGVARRFAREGYQVAMVSRTATSLDAARDHLTGVETLSAVGDAGDPASLGHALDSISKKRGPTDVLVYNAAAMRPKLGSLVTQSELLSDLATSVGGALTASQWALPSMVAAGRGSVLYTGGGLAIEPTPMMTTLGVGKAAIRNLAFSQFLEMKDRGVHVGTVTICGMVAAGTVFDPDRIADAFWVLHSQPGDRFEREIVFRGQEL